MNNSALQSVALPATAVPAFWAKVDRRGPNECWPWRGFRRPDGCGLFRKNRKALVASRVAWWLANKAEPSAYVCHTCDNPPCCNPAHLWLGTHADNMRDAKLKGRSPHPPLKTHCSHGHEFTPENIGRRKDKPTVKVCKTCLRRGEAEHRERKAARAI